MSGDVTEKEKGPKPFHRQSAPFQVVRLSPLLPQVFLSTLRKES
jgi:hypothetical protein